MEWLIYYLNKLTDMDTLRLSSSRSNMASNNDHVNKLQAIGDNMEGAYRNEGGAKREQV